MTHFNRLLEKRGLKIFFDVTSVSDLNAVRGFLAVFRIQRQRTVVRIGTKIASRLVKEALKGCIFTARRRMRFKNRLRVRFDTEGGACQAPDGSVVLNYVPYKYLVPVQASRNLRARLRTAMRIQEDRKVILVSCSSRDEVFAVVRAWDRFSVSKKPLLVFGIRKPDLRLADLLRVRGHRIYDRRSERESLYRLGESEITVLNTMGEFFKLMQAADGAIVGHDRNIFEPALLRVPILYFQCPLRMTRREKELAGLFGLYWRKNRMAKILLDRHGAAKPIQPRSFHRQIEKILNNPRPMIRGARQSVQALYARVLPTACEKAASVFAEAMQS